MDGNDKLEAAAVTAGFKAAVVVGLLGLALVFAGESMRSRDEGSKAPINAGRSATTSGVASQASGRAHPSPTESANVQGARRIGKVEP